MSPGWAFADRRAARLSAGIGLLALVPILIAAANTAHAADTDVNLGTAKQFSVLAGSGVTSTGVTKLEGSIGSHETPTITTDTPFVFTGTGTNHAGNGVVDQRQDERNVRRSSAGQLRGGDVGLQHHLRTCL